jgi:hypothetical protein
MCYVIVLCCQSLISWIPKFDQIPNRSTASGHAEANRREPSFNSRPPQSISEMAGQVENERIGAESGLRMYAWLEKASSLG